VSGRTGDRVDANVPRPAPIRRGEPLWPGHTRVPVGIGGAVALKASSNAFDRKQFAKNCAQNAASRFGRGRLPLREAPLPNQTGGARRSDKMQMRTPSGFPGRNDAVAGSTQA